MNMKYWIRIEKSDRGPYSAAEIVQSFGPNLPSSTPCAEVGKNTWSTIGELLTDIGSVLPTPEPPQPAQQRECRRNSGFVDFYLGLSGVVHGLAFLGGASGVTMNIVKMLSGKVIILPEAIGILVFRALLTALVGWLCYMCLRNISSK
jgi:hypothetical protein